MRDFEIYKGTLVDGEGISNLEMNRVENVPEDLGEAHFSSMKAFS